MNRQALYGFLIGVSVLAAVVIWFYAFVMPRGVPEPPAANLPSNRVTTERTPEARTAQHREPAPLDTPEPAPGVASDTAPPLFQDKPGTGAESTAKESGDSEPAPGRTEKIERIHEQLASIARSGGGASPQRVVELLGELRSAMGTNEVAGVDLRKLERTVKNADRIQALANEMKAIANNPSKQDRQRIREIMDEMRRLQGQIPESAEELRGAK